nr:RNA-directed RNA polymerase [Leviviridae sp.]
MRIKEQQSAAKILYDHFRGKTWHIGEHQLTKGDSQRCANAFTLWLLAIEDIAPCHCLERSFSTTNLIRWSGWSKIDVQRLLDDCKELLAVIRDYDPFMGSVAFRSFKLWLNNRLHSNIMFELLRPLCYRLHGGNANVFRDLNTILQFWSRLTLLDADWVEDDNIDDYCKLEESMKKWTYPETTLDCLRFIITQWFTGFSLDGLQPDFSNGATAEVKRGRGVAEKVRLGSRTIYQALADAEISFNSPYYTGFSLETRQVAKVRLVPKGICKKRVISMEPVVNQYYQFALFRGMDQWFRSHPEMHINLQDQDLTRRKALRGSRDLSYSTIDLSSASDTVTLTLVKSLFRDLPEMWRYMSLVRTPEVELPDGRIIEIEKYAPMGSSLCFPVECIVFSAIASYACMTAGIPQNYQVYGDDIIIDSRAYTACVRLLTELNFIVNIEKSFGPTSSFLEACGIEAYRGHDVTPCRMSRRFDVVKLLDGMSPQQLEGAIEFCNKLYDYGLYKCRRYLIQLTTSVYQNVPFSVDPEKGIYHPDPCAFGCKIRWNKRLQRREILIVTSHAKTAPGNSDIRYLRTLEKIADRASPLTPDTRVEVRCGLTRNSLRKQWVACADLGIS